MHGYRLERHLAKRTLKDRNANGEKSTAGVLAKLWKIGGILPSAAHETFVWSTMEAVLHAQADASENQEGLELD